MRSTPAEPTQLWNRGLRFGALLDFMRGPGSSIDESFSTTQVVIEVVKPWTQGKRASGDGCRGIEMFDDKDVGPAELFISHAWGGPFFDIVYSLRDSGLSENVYIWLDVLAVQQHQGSREEQKENSSDLNFDAVVRKCRALVQVMSENPEVSALDFEECFEGRAPELSQKAREMLPPFRIGASQSSRLRSKTTFQYLWQPMPKEMNSRRCRSLLTWRRPRHDSTQTPSASWIK